jgi:hypothetical protein
MAHAFCIQYEYGTLNPVEVILRKGRDKPNRGALYTHMEMSQQNLLYNYYILIKTLKKENTCQSW